MRASLFVKSRFRLRENPYSVLGVPVGAAAREVRAAYLRAALQTHPDVHGTAHHAAVGQDFLRIQEAYESIRSGVWLTDRNASAKGPSGAWAANQQVKPDGRPPYSAVGAREAERLFQSAFGKGVDEVLDEALAKQFAASGVKPGVHAGPIREGLFARLLKEARLAVSDRARASPAPQDSSQNPSSDHWTGQEGAPEAQHQVREALSREDGTRFVRVTTTTAWPDGRREVKVVDKPVYRL